MGKREAELGLQELLDVGTTDVSRLFDFRDTDNLYIALESPTRETEYLRERHT